MLIFKYIYILLIQLYIYIYIYKRKKLSLCLFIVVKLIHPALNNKTLFLTDIISTNKSTWASKVREQPKFFPIKHYHYPSPNSQ